MANASARTKPAIGATISTVWSGVDMTQCDNTAQVICPNGTPDDNLAEGRACWPCKRQLANGPTGLRCGSESDEKGDDAGTQYGAGEGAGSANDPSAPGGSGKSVGGRASGDAKIACGLCD
ncbi:hypothetical protein G6F57_019958 [Rhizopus arrhizus]|nr:hypothetical protein G6F57_019958 [Rhizopus arrhizus]